MGVLPASTRMPYSKFTYPRNGDILAPNEPMLVGLAITNLATGNFASEDTCYLSAPQQLDSSGQIQGHPFIVFETLTSPSQIAPTNPSLFSFFNGVTGVADSTGVVTTVVEGGLPAGFYRLSSIIATTNGQPVLLPVLQHGAVDDAIYLTVADGGVLPTNQTAIQGISTNSTASTTATGGGPTKSATPPATSASTTSNVGAAVGGALGGISFVALLFVLAWFLMRRKKRARPRFDDPVVLRSDDFGPPTAIAAEPYMMQLNPPPTASYPQKSARGQPVPVRRYASMTSVAPSYHTQVM